MATSIEIRIRGDTGANWESKNTVLKQREIGYDMTANRFKVGDGLTTWKDLAYVAPDVINDLTTGGTAKALSAEQGKTLKAELDTKANSSDVTNITNRVTELNQTINQDVIKSDDFTSEVWKFTLSDDSEVEKKVALWSS